MNAKFSLSLLALLALPLTAVAQKTAPTNVGTGAGQRWTFTSGPATLKSGPKGAGRIISLQYNGSEILHMDTGTATNYGSTFWPSPQAAWASNWPPSANIDGAGAYTATEADTSLLLNGLTDANNQVRINKKYWANASDTSFGQRFTIINTNTVAKAWAPWQNSRLPAGGLYIFPKGTDTVTGELRLLVRDTLNHRWFRYDSSTVPTSGTNKFYSDASQGWFAHVNKNRVLLIKKFTDTPFAKKAPGVEKEIEIYTTNNKAFTEMETQGSYDTIPAGDSIVWNVKWYVRKLPDSTSLTVGNMSIVNYINSVITGPVSIAPGVRLTQSSFGVNDRRVSFELSAPGQVSLSLVGANGQVVQNIHSGAMRAGLHQFTLKPAPKGVYWLVLKGASPAPQVRRVAFF
jgi:hypothetical protein